MNVLARIKQWIDVADWRSWVAHSVVAVAISLVSLALGFDLSATTWSVFVLFFVREAEQLALEVVYHERPHWNDHLWDFVFPSLAAWVTSLVWFIA